MNFVHVHASGRFDRSPESLKTQIESFIKEHDASIITLTELDPWARGDVVETFEGYGFHRRGKNTPFSNDTAIMWKKSDWKAVYNQAIKTTNTGWIRRGKLIPGQFAGLVILESVATKQRILVSVSHTPAHVQHGSKWYAKSQIVTTWFASVRGWRNKRNRLYKKYKCEGMFICADWNVDLKNKFFRSVVKSLQPGMKFVWDLSHLPEAGTLGKRLIDFTLFRGKSLFIVKRPQILTHTDASDHTPYKETFRLAGR